MVRRYILLAVVVVIVLATASYYYEVVSANSVTWTITANDGPQGNGVDFMPNSFAVKEEQNVNILFINHGSRPHQLIIPAFGVNTGLVAAGVTARVSFTPNTAGTFSFGEPPGTGLNPDRGNGMVGNVTILSP